MRWMRVRGHRRSVLCQSSWCGKILPVNSEMRTRLSLQCRKPLTCRLALHRIITIWPTAMAWLYKELAVWLDQEEQVIPHCRCVSWRMAISSLAFALSHVVLRRISHAGRVKRSFSGQSASGKPTTQSVIGARGCHTTNATGWHQQHANSLMDHQNQESCCDKVNRPSVARNAAKSEWRSSAS